ncbi:MAG: hypothetical protein KTV68_15365 [Acidimicrobiia bacterium]|nr:hypothetical protein [Acidimicrobiia bacterium]
MSWLPGVDNKLTAYRLVGAAWLVAGMALLWYALGLAKVGTMAKAALVALLGAPPAALYASTSVHAGNAQLVGGAIVLVALLLWESKRWPWWSVPVASGVAVWLNFNNASAVGAVVAYLAYRARKDRGQRRQLLLASASSFAVAVVSVIGWQAWQNHRKLADVEDLPIHQVIWGESGFQWQQIDDELRAVFTPFRDQWIPTYDVLTPLNGIADIGLLVLMGATLAVTARRSSHRYLTAGVVTAMAGFGVVTMLSTYAAGYNYFQLTPARYGLALLPLAAVAITPAVRRLALARLATPAVALATAGAVAYGIFASVTPTPDADVAETIRISQQEQTIANQQQLISEQEWLIEDTDDLLNHYRCQSGIDTHLVIEGCNEGN